MIKYRVWDTVAKEYLDESAVSINGHGDLAVFDATNIPVATQALSSSSQRFVIEQYTGLEDGCGVEIYGGDIVQVKTGLVGKVVYSNKYACFEIVAPGLPPYSFAELADAGLDIDGMVVIGNIHEDGELLEEKQ